MRLTSKYISLASRSHLQTFDEPHGPSCPSALCAGKTIRRHGGVGGSGRAGGTRLLVASNSLNGLTRSTKLREITVGGFKTQLQVISRSPGRRLQSFMPGRLFSCCLA